MKNTHGGGVLLFGQQQPGAFRRQNADLLYLKFRADFHELSLNSQKQQECKNLNRKSAYECFLRFVNFTNGTRSCKASYMLQTRKKYFHQGIDSYLVWTETFT